jgi:MFS family permease
MSLMFFRVLLLTFISYTCYHLSRRPLSVVKNILSRNCTELSPPSDIIFTNTTTVNNWCDWKPFGGDESNTLLGLLDSSFLFSYAICMFFSGFIAERCHLRYFLALGMILSGIFTYLFGIAFYYNIHSYYYFVFVQIICGNNHFLFKLIYFFRQFYQNFFLYLYRKVSVKKVYTLQSLYYNKNDAHIQSL